MKRMKLLAGMVLAVALAFSAGYGALSAFAETQAAEENTAVSLDEDFDGSSVLVTMAEEVSEVNKKYDKSYFGDIEISSIEDLSAMTGNIAEKEYFDESKFRQILQLHLPVDSKENVLNVIDKLEDVDGVLRASPNYYASVAEYPNDLSVVDQWGMIDEGINATDAWDITTGSSEVKVGIIDTGIANHPDLNANLAAGWDFYNDNSITNDDPTGHGTHVAGIIGAVGNNGTGVVGVNWEVTLVPLQVTYWDEEKQNWRLDGSATVDAIYWAIDNDIPILNYSAWGEGAMSEVRNALKVYKGLFVCISGNDGINIDQTKRYPCEYANETNDAYDGISNHVISVGALDEDEERSSFSNYGEDTVSIYAPGGDILSTIPTNLCSTICSQPNSALTENERQFKRGHVTDGYHNMSGTSMAAPHVAGIAALLLSMDSELTGAELKDIIMESAVDCTIHLPNGSSQEVKKASAYNAVILNQEVEEAEKYYVIIEKRHWMNSGNPETMAKVVLEYDDSYTITAPETYTYTERGSGGDIISTDVRKFTQWVMDLDVPNKEPAELEWIQLSTSRTLTISGKDIAKYYPNYDSYTDGNIYIDAMYTESANSGCVATGTYVTLADGSQKLVEDLAGNEMLLVWDFYAGAFDAAPILCIDSDPPAVYEVIELKFSDGTAVDVISEHGFWDCTLNKYVYLDANAAQYIGHWFNKQTADANGVNAWTQVQLTEVTITQEYTAAYSPVTYGHLCYYVNGMLSMPGGIGGLFNILEVDEQTMAYDAEAMAADIELYGLYTYEELNALVPVTEELFEAVNGQYLKIAVCKGILTVEEIGELVERYSGLFA